MTTLVVIPYFGCPDLVDRCVRSVLAQTDRDIAVLVLGDGEEPPVSVRDDRLEVLTFRENHGPYWHFQAALQASPFEHYAPMGADDWIEPDHLERLAAAGDDVITGTVWFHPMAGEVNVHEGNYEVGRFTTRTMLSVGGYNPTERIGQDTLLIHLLNLVGGVATLLLAEPTYHRIKRPGSLMTSPVTGRGTPYRNDMRRRNREIYRECERIREPALIRRYREAFVPQHIADAIAEEAELIRHRLGQAVAA